MSRHNGLRISWYPCSTSLAGEPRVNHWLLETQLVWSQKGRVVSECVFCTCVCFFLVVFLVQSPPTSLHPPWGIILITRVECFVFHQVLSSKFSCKLFLFQRLLFSHFTFVLSSLFRMAHWLKWVQIQRWQEMPTILKLQYRHIRKTWKHLSCQIKEIALTVY